MTGITERSRSFYRHARVGGHPAFSAKHFWISAGVWLCEGRGGNARLEIKKLAGPANN